MTKRPEEREPRMTPEATNVDTCSICGGHEYSCNCTPDEQAAFYEAQKGAPAPASPAPPTADEPLPTSPTIEAKYADPHYFTKWDSGVYFQGRADQHAATLASLAPPSSSDPLLAEVRDALAKATPGEWVDTWEEFAAQKDHSEGGVVVSKAPQACGFPVVGLVWVDGPHLCVTREDAHLIAHAPTWLAALAARLQEETKRADVASEMFTDTMAHAADWRDTLFCAASNLESGQPQSQPGVASQLRVIADVLVRLSLAVSDGAALEGSLRHLIREELLKYLRSREWAEPLIRQYLREAIRDYVLDVFYPNTGTEPQRNGPHPHPGAAGGVST